MKQCEEGRSKLEAAAKRQTEFIAKKMEQDAENTRQQSVKRRKTEHMRGTCVIPKPLKIQFPQEERIRTKATKAT